MQAFGIVAGLIIGIVALVYVIKSHRDTKRATKLTEEMREAQKPRLEIEVRGDSPVQRLRREKVNEKRIHGNVHFAVTIFNQSTTANTVKAVKAYEMLSNGELHKVKDAFSQLYRGGVFLSERVPKRFDIPAGGSVTLQYNGKDVRLAEWGETYLFRVIVTDRGGNDWPGDAPPKGVVEER